MMHDIIVFENLRFRRSTRERVVGVIKNLHCGERFLKDAFSVNVSIGYAWTVRQTGGKKNPFSNKNGFLSTESTRRKLGTKSCDKIGGFMRLEI